MADKRMEGKKVLVTGAGTGIGRGVALEYAKEGADVVLHYSHSSSGADSAVEEIKKMGRKAKAIQADFNEIEPVKKLAKEAIAFLGGLDVLVNNAGITTNIPFEEVRPEQFDTLYHVNVRAGFFLTQACLSALEASGKGIVINFSSGHANFGMTEHSVYAGTKGAILSYSREVALELIQKGIRVNTICPGWVFVENHQKTLGEGFDVREEGKIIPVGFAASAADMGRTCIFLSTDDSRFICGQAIVADGGQSAIMPLTGDFRARRTEQWGQGYVSGLETKRPAAAR